MRAKGIGRQAVEKYCDKKKIQREKARKKENSYIGNKIKMIRLLEEI